MEKYMKTSENQYLNYFLLETLAWINYRRIPNYKELSLFPKICCFQKSRYIGKLLQWSSLWICKKSGGLEKSQVWNGRSLKVPLSFGRTQSLKIFSYLTTLSCMISSRQVISCVNKYLLEVELHTRIYTQNHHVIKLTSLLIWDRTENSCVTFTKSACIYVPSYM